MNWNKDRAVAGKKKIDAFFAENGYDATASVYLTDCGYKIMANFNSDEERMHFVLKYGYRHLILLWTK